MALIRCKECGKKVWDKAESCPNCGYKTTLEDVELAFNKSCKRTRWKIAILLAVASIVFFLISSLFDGTTSRPSEYEIQQRDRIFALKSAYSDAKTSALQQLKSPSTAKFADFSELKYHNQGDTLYTLHSWVDSQNSFGAMIRTDFKFKVKVGDFGLGFFSDLEFY